MEYAVISKETIGLLHASYNSLKQSPAPRELIILVELRVSQINSCNYCCNLHRSDALKFGINVEKLDQLPSWRDSSYFTDAEREALSWAEILTKTPIDANLAQTKLIDFFSEREIVDITAAVALMNALNRIAITLR